MREHTGFHNKEHYSPDCPECRKKSPELREKIAELEHEQWIVWSKSISQSEVINPDRLKRWKRLWALPYHHLTEAEKDQDREWADKSLALIPDTTELKRQIDIRRDNAFAESLFGSLEHQIKMQAKVDTYDTVLGLMKKAIGGK